MDEQLLDLTFDAVYLHPREHVWAALVRADALAAWFLENDFEPCLGKDFTLRGPDIGDVRCTVMVLDPPRRMEWLWRSRGLGPTRVIFTLDEAIGGTKLTIRHFGPTNPAHRRAIASGWPTKLTVLRAWLTADRPAHPLDARRGEERAPRER